MKREHSGATRSKDYSRTAKPKPIAGGNPPTPKGHGAAPYLVEGYDAARTGNTPDPGPSAWTWP